MAVTGERVVLKDQILVTIEGLYKKVKDAEEATPEKKRKSTRKKAKQMLHTNET